MLLCSAVCVAALAPNLFIVVPVFLRSQGQDERHIGAVMGAFPLAALTALQLWARVAERRGARLLLTSGVSVAALGCVMFALAGSTTGWLLARALQGAGWSAVLVGGSLATTQLAPPGRLAQAIGVSGVLTLLSTALGPIFGELIAHHFGWPWVFRAAVLAAAVGGLLTRLLPPLHAQGARAPADKATPPESWPPRIPGDQLRPLAAMLLVATGYGSVIAFLADHSHLVGPFEVSPFFDAYVATAILVRLTIGSLPDRVGAHPVLIPSFIGQAASLAALSLLRAQWQLWPVGVLFGVTHGLYYPTLTALVFQRAPEERRARALASVHFMFSSGMVLASFAGGLLAERWGYPAVYMTSASLTAAATVLIVIDRAIAAPKQRAAQGA